MEVCGQLHALVALPLGKESLISIGLEAEWAPEPVWTQWVREENPIIARLGNELLSFSP
jgi:hypothetical protein